MVLQPCAGNRRRCHIHETGTKEAQRADLLLPQEGDCARPLGRLAGRACQASESRTRAVARVMLACSAQHCTHSVFWWNCSLLDGEGVRVQAFAPSY